MNKSNKNMALDSFNAILLKTIVNDYDINKKIQKSVDMNANYVFSMHIPTSLETIADQKVSSLLKNSAKWKWVILKLSSMIGVVVFLGIILYNFMNNSNLNNENNPVQNYVQPIVNSDDMENKDKDSIVFINENIEPTSEPEVIVSTENISSNAIVFESVQINDINIDENIKTVTKPEEIYASRVPQQTIRERNPYRSFDFSYAEEITKKSKPIVKITTNDYKIDGRAWSFTTYKHNSHIPYKMVNSTNYTFLPTYIGEPFKEMFSNMSFISNKIIIPIGKSKDNSITNSVLNSNIISLKYRIADLTEADKFFANNENYKLLNPFYINNTEVTNNEYLEFVGWVQKYNGFDTLTIEDYRFGHEAFEYTFHKSNPEVEKHFGSNTINIHPNTECWRQRLAHNEPLVELYLRHPVYAQHPVVGISYWQALAYTDWLTFIWQTMLDEQNIPYNIEFDLPTEYEWESAAIENINISKYKYLNRSRLYSNKLSCNLTVEQHNDQLLRIELGLHDIDYYDDVRIFSPKDDITYSVTSTYETSNKNEYKILNMEANVSEWTKMDYSPFWSDYRAHIKKTICSNNRDETKYLLEIEEYFDNKYNCKNGKMVRGGNWLDKRYQISLTEAIDAKVFIDPNKQLPTIGFRYLMRVNLKNEKEFVKKVNIIGHNLENIDYSLIKSVSSSKNYYSPSINNFTHIPAGSFNFKDKTTTVSAFWAQKTEVTNLEWMLFLNYLIDNNLNDKLAKCIPADKDWRLKMVVNDNAADFNIKLKDKLSCLAFPKQFITENKIDKIEFPFFAFEPVTGISHEAAKLFADWLSEMYGFESKFRLPNEEEWEYMASGGNEKFAIYPWNGDFVRSSTGAIQARFNTLYFFQKESKIFDSINNIYVTNAYYYNYDEIKDLPEFIDIVKNQNRELTLNMNDSINSPKAYGPVPVKMYVNNNFELFDLAGNAAEMIDIPTKTKGGSWASIRCFIEIKSEEKWNGQASDCVGFRLIKDYLGKPVKK